MTAQTGTPRTDLRSEMSTLRADLQNEMRVLRADLQKEIHDLRVDLGGRITRLLTLVETQLRRSGESPSTEGTRRKDRAN